MSIGLKIKSIYFHSANIYCFEDLAYSSFRLRPIINRLISLVPAPISYNLASLRILPVA